MADGLLSIRDKRKHDPNTESFKETYRQTNKSTKFNHCKYVSPNLVNSSPVVVVVVELRRGPCKPR